MKDCNSSYLGGKDNRFSSSKVNSGNLEFPCIYEGGSKGREEGTRKGEEQREGEGGGGKGEGEKLELSGSGSRLL